MVGDAGKRRHAIVDATRIPVQARQRDGRVTFEVGAASDVTFMVGRRLATTCTRGRPSNSSSSPET